MAGSDEQETSKLPHRNKLDGLSTKPLVDESDSVDSTDPSASAVVAEPLVFHAPRRRVLGIGVGVGVGLTTMSVNAAKPPRSQRPQPGDQIVFRFGDRVGQAVKPSDVPGGAELLQVISKDANTGVLRDGSRLNGVNLVKVDENAVDEQTRPFVLEGVIAYSSVCTHQGCDLTQWVLDTTTFKCYCHYSEFDATKLGEPNHGPAKRRLAVLPLKLNERSEFVVADHFNGRVGFPKKR